jgi:hypothetical protein
MLHSVSTTPANHRNHPTNNPTVMEPIHHAAYAGDGEEVARLVTQSPASINALTTWPTPGDTMQDQWHGYYTPLKLAAM